MEKLRQLSEELESKEYLLLSTELKDVNPKVFELLKVNKRFDGGVITSLLRVIKYNIIGIGDKPVKTSPLTTKELAIRIYGDVKYTNEMKYALEATHESGLLDDFPTDLLPEYLQEMAG